MGGERESADPSETLGNDKSEVMVGYHRSRQIGAQRNRRLWTTVVASIGAVDQGQEKLADLDYAARFNEAASGRRDGTCRSLQRWLLGIGSDRPHGLVEVFLERTQWRDLRFPSSTTERQITPLGRNDNNPLPIPQK